MSLGWFPPQPNTKSAPAADAPLAAFVPWGSLASAASMAIGFAAGWQVWLLAAVGILPWLPAFAIDVTRVGRRFGPLALLYVLVITQIGHFLEHLAQMTPIHLLGLSGPAARGVVGQLDTEWVHFLWNSWVILAALVLVARFPRNPWLRFAAIFAVWHEIEHAYLLSVYLTAGHAGHPGLLAAGGVLGGGLPLARPDLHFLYNLIETVPLAVAFVVEARRSIGADRRAAESLTGQPATIAPTITP